MTLPYPTRRSSDLAAIADQMKGISADKLPWKGRVPALQEEKEALWAEREKAGQSNAKPLAAERVFAELRQVLPNDAIVTLDAGTMCLQADRKSTRLNSSH